MMYTSRIYYIVLRIITHICIIYLGGNMFASVCGCTKHDAYHYVFKIFSIYFVCMAQIDKDFPRCCVGVTKIS